MEVARISVPARNTKALARSKTRCNTIPGEGHLYAGNSMTNGGVSLLNRVFFNSQAIGMATTAPKNVITNIIIACKVTQPPAQETVGKNAATISQ